MCKHVAAVLYGIGGVDQQPELLFTLRKVDQQDLIAKAGSQIVQSQNTQPKRPSRKASDNTSKRRAVLIRMMKNRAARRAQKQ